MSLFRLARRPPRILFNEDAQGTKLNEDAQGTNLNEYANDAPAEKRDKPDL
jgi:hypothetical protein